jgi:hypothetical protein
MHFGGGGHFGRAFHFGGGGRHFGGHFGHAFRFGGGHFGHGARFGRAGHFGSARRFAGARHLGRAGARSPLSRAFAGRGFAGHGPLAAHAGGLGGFGRSAAIDPAARSALSSRAIASGLRDPIGLRDPTFRAVLSASAATVALGGAELGWWRHGDGGYGWVGPLFWPFAYDDIYDYAIWGYGPAFWGYGYTDVYAALFAPYGYEELAGYLPQGVAGGSRYATGSPGGPPEAPAYLGRPSQATRQLAQMCGEESRIVDLPIDRVRHTIGLSDEQSAALNDLDNALAKAAQDIRSACPADVSLTAPDRLAAMGQRLQAMLTAVEAVEPLLEKFYGFLNDEQKARLTALAEEQRRDAIGTRNAGPPVTGCEAAPPGVTDWPVAEIERRLHPTEAQSASLAKLKDASAQAADMLKGSCNAEGAITPPARLAAAGERLRTMLQAVSLVQTALGDFYGSLSDEQKAQFEAIGRARIGRHA